MTITSIRIILISGDRSYRRNSRVPGRRRKTTPLLHSDRRIITHYASNRSHSRDPPRENASLRLSMRAHRHEGMSPMVAVVIGIINRFRYQGSVIRPRYLNGIYSRGGGSISARLIDSVCLAGWRYRRTRAAGEFLRENARTDSI